MARHYKSLIDECLAEECDCQHYCLLKEMVLSSRRFDPRFLIQMKLVEIHKWHLGQKHSREHTWDEALRAWDTEGHAKRFSDLWPEHPETPPQTLYKHVVNQKS